MLFIKKRQAGRKGRKQGQMQFSALLFFSLFAGLVVLSACSAFGNNRVYNYEDPEENVTLATAGSDHIDQIVDPSIDMLEDFTLMSGGRDRKLDAGQSGAGLFFSHKDGKADQAAENVPDQVAESVPEQDTDIADTSRYIPELSPTQATAARLSDEEIGALDNKKIGWGAKHNGHDQPEIPKATRQMFLQHDTIFMGNSEDPVIYLTFDAGYENGYTESILDTLYQNNVRAAFFITGHYLKTNPQIVQRMLDENHIVGNHTDKHTSMPDDTDEKIHQELSDLSAAFLAVTGSEMKYMRPPMGEYSERTLALTARHGYCTVLWSFAYVDYDESQAKGADYAFQKITDNLHNGGIFLLHTESRENAEVLGKVISSAKDMGFEFKDLDSFQ